MGLALETWIALGGLVVAVAGVAVAVLQWRSGRPLPPPPPSPSPLPALLRAQRAYAGALPYLAALGGTAPELSAVYVALRAGRIERLATASGPAGGSPAAEHRVTEVDLAEVVSAPGGAVLVGGAGSGKSTVVSRVVAEAAERRLAGTSGAGAVPVVVPARLLGPSAELPRAVAAGLARTAGLAEDDLSALLRAAPAGGGHWLVIVDGLDEIVDGGERRDALRRLAAWLAEPGAPYRVVVTTRPPREGELAPLRAAGAAEFHLRPFDVDGLAAFARRWFAAVHPDGGGDLADRFLARVAADRLGGLVRTPLLATIAAVVFGRSLDQPLPAGRASLYDAFVTLSLQRRRSPRDVAETDPDDARSRVTRGDPTGAALLWELFLHTRDLLGHLADRRLAGDPTPLADLATGWVTAPHTWSATLATEADSARACRLVAADPAWAHLVPALLAETGLVGPAGGGWEFVHPSFAEYLAAEHRALDVADGLAAVADDATRGFGLFAVAAAVTRTPAAGAEVAALLDGDPADLRALAEILADGVPLDPEFQRRAAEDIVGRCRQVDYEYASFPPEEALAAVVTHPYGAARLAEVAASESEPAPFRGGAARLLAGAGRREAVEALLPALDDLRLADGERVSLASAAVRYGAEPVAARALDALRAMPAAESAIVLAERGTPADRAGVLGWITGGAGDRGRDRYQRVMAAAALARHGDEGALRVLDGLLTKDVLAVEPVAEHGGPAGRRRLAVLAGDPAVASGIRHTAVAALLNFAAPDERESTVETVRGLLAGADAEDRASILVDLVTHAPGADRGAAAAFARDPSVGVRQRGTVAAALLRDGAPAEREIGFDVLSDIARDAEVRKLERAEALRRLAMYGGPSAPAAVLAAVGADDPPEVRLGAARGLVRYGDPGERAAGRRILTALVESGRAPDARTWASEPWQAALDLAEYGTAADRAWLAGVGADGETPVDLRGGVLEGLFRYGTGRERDAARTLLERLVREAGEDWPVRGLLARALAEYGGAAERQRLREWADDAGQAAGTRYRAAQALAERGGSADRTSAGRVFAALLDDPSADPVLRHFAANDLYVHGGPAERAELERRARDRTADPETRLLAAVGLQAAHDDEATLHTAAGALAQVATDPDADPEIRTRAATELVEHGYEEAHAAAGRLLDDPMVGFGVAQAFLTTWRPIDPAHTAAATARLTELLRRDSTLDSDESQLVADLLVRRAEAADTVLEVAFDPAVPEGNRLSAAFALHTTGHDDAVALLARDGTLPPDLRAPVGRWLADEDEPHRAVGLAALASIAADPAVPGTDRQVAVGTLGRRFDRAEEALTRLATEPGVPADARCAAAAALAEHGTEAVARRGAEVLAELAATAPTWWIRLHAVLHIHMHATGVPLPTGPEAHPVVRAFAARCQAADGDAAGTEVLRALLADPTAPDEVRAMAVGMLAETGTPDAAATAMSAPDMPTLVRAEAAIALATPDADPAAVELLARLAGDPAAPDDIRAAAVAWLSKVDDLGTAARAARDPDTPGLPRLAAATALLAAGREAPAEDLVDEPGGRLWLWAIAALNQHGDETDRGVDLVAAIRHFGARAVVGDPLLRHLTTADWYEESDPPLDALLLEVGGVFMVMAPDDPVLWREAAREVTRHGEGYQRLLARAVLRDLDPAAAAELDKTPPSWR